MKITCFVHCTVLDMLFPRKAGVFAVTQSQQFSTYIHINISRKIFQVLIMDSVSNRIKIHCIFFNLIFYGIDVGKCTKSTGEEI